MGGRRIDWAAISARGWRAGSSAPTVRVSAPLASALLASGALALGALTACQRDSASATRSGARSREVAAETHSATPAEADRLSALRADALPTGFELADKPRTFTFPLDHGPHPAFRHEWWYVTGHLDAENGEPFGFELTFFRFALKPPLAGAAAVSDTSAKSEGSSAWRATQIYMAHFAVSDIGRKDFKVSERFARDALGLAGAQADPFRVSLGDWSLGVDTGDVGAASGAANVWRLTASNDSYSVDLDITPASPIMLNGDAGLSQKSDAVGAASYYYSIPRMTAQGKLVRDGKELNVKGTVWLDREWGSGSLGGDQQGWDWYALQFDDGSALMFYALRKRDGARDGHSAGTWLAADGAVKRLSSDEVQIDVKNEWESPRGGRYPARWRMRVPPLGLDVDIEPRMADQELATSTRYWEGASTVRGTRDGKPIGGKAYVELVGYAKKPSIAGRLEKAR